VIHIEVRVDIDRPAAEVFEYLEEVENNPRWLSGMRSSTWTSQSPVGVGSTYAQVSQFLGRQIHTSFEVTRHEPGRLITIESREGSSFPITVTRIVEPDGDGRARVTELVDAGVEYLIFNLPTADAEGVRCLEERHELAAEGLRGEARRFRHREAQRKLYGAEVVRRPSHIARECDQLRQREMLAMLRRDPAVVAELAARGITDMDRVMFDTWTYGHALIPEQYRGRRVGWVDVWYRAAPGANPYAHPVNGLHPVVDLNRMELLDLGSTGRVDPPRVMGEYVPRHIPGYQARDDVRPLEISQPDGVSFQLDGNAVSWQNWSLRVGFNYREGLVLHQVSYADGGRVRPIAPGVRWRR